jgi:hypothetical protein
MPAPTWGQMTETEGPAKPTGRSVEAASPANMAERDMATKIFLAQQSYLKGANAPAMENTKKDTTPGLGF